MIEFYNISVKDRCRFNKMNVELVKAIVLFIYFILGGIYFELVIKKNLEINLYYYFYTYPLPILLTLFNILYKRKQERIYDRKFYETIIRSNIIEFIFYYSSTCFYSFLVTEFVDYSDFITNMNKSYIIGIIFNLFFNCYYFIDITD